MNRILIMAGVIGLSSAIWYWCGYESGKLKANKKNLQVWESVQKECEDILKKHSGNLIDVKAGMNYVEEKRKLAEQMTDDGYSTEEILAALHEWDARYYGA